MEKNIIEVTNLTKSFVKYEKEPGLIGMLKAFVNAKKVIKTAVDNVSFNIKEGEIVGYIGANGAGKSTTIKMLTGILTPSSGSVMVDNIDPIKNRKENAMKIGVVFGQKSQLWWDLPLVESFTVLKEIYNVSKEDFEERMIFFDELLGINEFIKSPVRTLSLGQRMKADIVASLLHNPKILYLDEPTIGLDVNAKRNMREAIKKMNKQFNTTVILTTHDLDDIEELCNRIIIIDNSKIIYKGTLKDIKNKFGYMKCVKFTTNQSKELLNIDLNSKFNLNDTDLYIKQVDDKIEVHFNKNKVSAANIIEYAFSKVTIIDVGIFVTNIEEIVGNIYDKGEVIENIN